MYKPWLHIHTHIYVHTYNFIPEDGLDLKEPEQLTKLKNIMGKMAIDLTK